MVPAPKTPCRRLPRACAPHRSRLGASAAARTAVADRLGSTRAWCHCHGCRERMAPGVGGKRIPAGAGDGGIPPTASARYCHAKCASMTVTLCSRIAGSRASNMRPVAGNRIPGFTSRVCATIGGTFSRYPGASNTLQSSVAPINRNPCSTAVCAPGPHACTSTVEVVPPVRETLSVTGPSGVWKHNHAIVLDPGGGVLRSALQDAECSVQRVGALRIPQGVCIARRERVRWFGGHAYILPPAARSHGVAAAPTPAFLYRRISGFKCS